MYNNLKIGIITKTKGLEGDYFCAQINVFFSFRKMSTYYAKQLYIYIDE